MNSKNSFSETNKGFTCEEILSFGNKETIRFLDGFVHRVLTFLHCDFVSDSFDPPLSLGNCVFFLKCFLEQHPHSDSTVPLEQTESMVAMGNENIVATTVDEIEGRPVVLGELDGENNEYHHSMEDGTWYNIPSGENTRINLR